MVSITTASSIFINNVRNLRIPYFSILGVLAVVVLVSFLWRPLNPNRTKYMPLSPQAETTVQSSKNIQTMLGNVKIDIVSDKNQPQTTIESSDTPEDDNTTSDKTEDDTLYDKTSSFQYVIARGDTLQDILQGYNVNSRDIYQLTGRFKQLANLRIGQQISWTMDENGNLLNFYWSVSSTSIRAYEKVKGRFVESIETVEGEAKKIALPGIITSNFVADARKSGLSSNEISTVIQMLQWRFDFRRLREGDRFVVLLSRNMNGDKILNSQVLGVRIQSGKKDYFGILADDGNYYDTAGNSLSQSFLRYPLAKRARISSSFNLRRLNPVTGVITPHNGVDFAVSRKTPVLAVGDGQVMVAKYSPSAGYYITLRHGRQYITRYMHLDKLMVKPGQRVKRGDTIALSGNTGRSTGPHLHYEIRINHKPVNPITAPLPVAEGLTGKSKSVFLEKVEDIKAQLEL